MDILGSIMGSMQAPPSLGEKEKKAARAQKEKLRKAQEARKKEWSDFRSKVESRIREFIKDPKKAKLVFESMDKVHRVVVHDMADNASLTNHAFGDEDIDRHVVVWKTEHAPCDDEIAAMRAGVKYDPAAKRQETKSSSSQKNQPKFQSTYDYMDKYRGKIIGDDVQEATPVIAPDRAFGCVPSANKRDHRSIEETLNEIRARKKPRLERDTPPRKS